MLGYPDGGYERTDEQFFNVLAVYEREQQLRNELSNGLTA